MRRLVPLLVLLGVVLSATVIPGVFIVDEDNYLVNVLALRQGRVTVANTEGLSSSPELLFFDPGPWSRRVDRTPVASTAPPLYAPLALPFLWFGWRGLVALNTIGYLVTIALVFRWTERHAAAPSTPWLAAAAFAFGGFAIEYAQGVWPHGLSLALTTGGLYAAARVVDPGARSGAGLASLAALLLGLATGVRYQNAVVLAVAGLAIVVWAPRRWRAAAGFAAGAAPPIVASMFWNHARLGSWNPISKGPG
jgi:hypothetical protein